ncbi:MAG: ribosome recycling factor [Candidatus Sungbacteria bacterium RIFCSPHIGHO2_01_FULL_50_25]|uniref:Ribosome-recycling factor n=1 Tax=Candidatus Sungbacteria bacterium RIFCSPHIGHO2_01_FULL_50_25 TaxID=1802265 RepID=A0A1G2KE13_9BACT|nr:MAG: ribosome recycling factor [Candidatus Sungbacteria bacterium RIFCSPHIGHO2_01_FULL_50_25]
MDIQKLKQSFEHVIESFKFEIASLRTGRATPALVEDIEVECYGSSQPLKAVASIASPGPKELVIQPWDKSVLPAIEKAIQASNLGINPIADKDTVRLALPQLTEERRRELAKFLGKHTEEARIRIRRDREDALRDVDRKEKAKEISEDERFRQKSEIQKAVDDVNKKIEEIAAAKEKEIMAV